MSTRIVFNNSGFKEILTGEWVHGLVDEEAEKMLTKAGNGYEKVVKKTGLTRWTGFVQNKDNTSLSDESENKTLSKAVR